MKQIPFLSISVIIKSSESQKPITQRQYIFAQVKYQCKMTATFMDDCSSVTKVEDFFFYSKNELEHSSMAI